VCESTDESHVVAEARLEPGALDEFAFASRKMPELMHYRLIGCPTCDTLYANPAPGPAALTEAYATAAYDSAIESRFAAETYARLVRRRAGNVGRRAALDIGTGDGAFLAELDALGFDRVEGIEPSDAPIDAAPEGIRERIRRGVFIELSLALESYSLVSIFQTLEHVHDPMAVCRRILGILESGGALVLVCHDRLSLVNRIMGRRSPIYDIEHLQLFSVRSLRELLERAGFSDVKVRRVINRYPLRYWVRLAPMPKRLGTRVKRSLESSRVGRLPISLPVGNIGAVAYKR
jgi:SAM-dependent methyltransferase